MNNNKSILKQAAFILVALFGLVQTKAQSLPISTYGVWDRSASITNYSKPNVDFVLGIEADEQWSVISPTRGSFDFSYFQKELDIAYANNKIIRFSIEVGPDAPDWMYDIDADPTNNPYPQIQKIYTNGGNAKSGWPYYPQYLTTTYKDYYFELIRQFSLFLRNQPQAKFNLIAFVQVKTGCTGDETPFKGNIITPSDDITSTDWETFREKSFTIFKNYFNDVPDKKVVLIFNSVDPSKDLPSLSAWNWLNTNIDKTIGFGIKGGAYNRGHHLTGEQSFKDQWAPYLINPKGLKLFSAAEMDNTWTNGYFAINPDLGFYWGVLAGLNVGLSTYDLNAGSMAYVTSNASPRETFRMFTKYAKQVYPATATTAFSIFHEGLNSANTKKFPENIYGKSSQSIVNRYTAICKAYESRGARMDDLLAVVQGQVGQRANQTGFNDAGWDIAEGNIERFFTQINPDDTSIGLFRVQGEITSTSSKYDRFARSFENATGKNTMYFKFDSEVFTNSTPKSLQFKIIWLDKNAGSTWSFRYKSSTGSKDAVQVTGLGDNTWKEVNFTITDAVIDRTGVNGSDFTLVNTDSVDDIFNGIEVGIERTTLSVSSNTIPSTDFIPFFKQNEFSASINFNSNSKANIKLFTINGSRILSEDILLKAGQTIFSKDLAVPAGIYIAVLKTDDKSVSQKLIKK
jgi:hypothetical protein